MSQRLVRRNNRAWEKSIVAVVIRFPSCVCVCVCVEGRGGQVCFFLRKRKRHVLHSGARDNQKGKSRAPHKRCCPPSTASPSPRCCMRQPRAPFSRRQREGERETAMVEKGKYEYTSTQDYSMREAPQVAKYPLYASTTHPTEEDATTKWTNVPRDNGRWRNPHLHVMLTEAPAGSSASSLHMITGPSTPVHLCAAAPDPPWSRYPPQVRQRCCIDSPRTCFPDQPEGLPRHPCRGG